MIIKQLAVGEMAVFCYIIACRQTRQAAVIDPGGDEAEILNQLKEMDLTLLYIINTHCHPDHVCGNGPIRKATGAQTVLHEDDMKLLNDPVAAEYFSRMGLPFAGPIDLPVCDGDRLKLGRLTLEIIHTPGHTPGGICILCENDLFTGDSLFVGAAGRVDLPGGDFNTLITSLEEKIATLPDETIIRPGHDYGDSITSTVGREKAENPYLGGEWG
ncbi:MBL fold metallo-hydrolase [Thermodesulfobacteriota bacterium]